MASYKITADGGTLVAGRDAYAVTVRVERDEADLGLWQTWISGIADVEIDRQSQPLITKLQRRRIAAELLADILEADARAGHLRDSWQPDATVLEPTSAQAIIAYAARSALPAPDFREGDTLRAFET